MLALLIGLVIAAILFNYVDESSGLAALVITLGAYVMICLHGSVLRADVPEACNKSYGIDKFVYTKLFCEVKDK